MCASVIGQQSPVATRFTQNTLLIVSIRALS
jgi:hypothetical protein